MVQANVGIGFAHQTARSHLKMQLTGWTIMPCQLVVGCRIISCCPLLLELMSSEPLTLDEEVHMQEEWHRDERKCRRAAVRWLVVALLSAIRFRHRMLSCDHQRSHLSLPAAFTDKLSSTASTAATATATTVVELTVMYWRRKRQHRHHHQHQHTSCRTIVNTDVYKSRQLGLL